MRSSSLLLLLVSCVALASVASVASADATPFPYSWETKWWTAQLDNFNFADSSATFQLKYLINEQWYAPGGPIFFYTGNEGPVELFANNTGFMWDIAPEFNAMIVFAEHRYYGETLPFGNASFTTENFVHLSAEQALADYALFLASLKHNDTRIADAEVIAFGGSYGGMLASWFRLKYPHVVAGAIAGSAPVWFFDTLRKDFDVGSYNRIASDDFRAVSQTCFDGIAASWTALTSLPLGVVTQVMGLCPGSLNSAADVTNILWPWLTNIYSTLPMGDYPYPASFLGLLPGNPVNVTCGYFSQTNMSALQLVQATRRAADLYYNASEWTVPNQGTQGSCYNLTATASISTLGAGDSWSYQSCSEMVMPIGQYGPPNDLFYPAPWNLAQTVLGCQEQFDVTPRPTWITQQFGGPLDWKDATNIVFSNGNLDPWSGGGVRKNLSATVVAILVEGGAHHFDLRASTPLDTPGVVRARQEEVEWIKTFIKNPSPKDPQQPLAPACDDDEEGSDENLTKRAIVMVSVFCTLVAMLVVGGLFKLCCSSKAVSDSSKGSTNYQPAGYGGLEGQ